jgi:hypothetical protein
MALHRPAQQKLVNAVTTHDEMTPEQPATGEPAPLTQRIE